MKKEYICSPYRPTGQNPEAERKRNVEKAQTACRLAIDAGYLSLAPHLYFTQMLNDDQRRTTGSHSADRCGIPVDRRQNTRLTVWRAFSGQHGLGC